MDEARVQARARRMTVNALLDGYGSLSVPQLLATMAPEFHHQVLPESLGMKPRNREAFAQHAAGIFSIFDEFRMIPKSIIDDGPGNVAVVHARMQGTLKGGAGEWVNECVMMIQLSRDGSQVVGIMEFVDSAKALEMARKHAPDDFGCGSTEPKGSRREGKNKGGEDETTDPKSITLLFGLGLAQLLVVIFLLYLAQGWVF
ncbi:hypothetical protein ABKA04_000011 [Annulohypoxylon sp. FPYF3050]|nr:hypothetical protein F5Y02DRAFT_427391 [Annulohypoxylon stygium]